MKQFRCKSCVQLLAAGFFLTAILSGAAGLAADTAPQIVQNPETQTVGWGTNASMTLVATGAEPLFCQWFKDGLPLGDQTSISSGAIVLLAIPSAQFGDAGIYSAMVSNALGAVNTGDASLIVVGPPVITNVTGDTTTSGGLSVQLVATAQGPDPITYQWFFNGAVLTNATNATLYFPSVEAADAGTYWLQASNVYGVSTGQPIELQVLTAPVILGQPMDTPARAGGTVLFSVDAGGEEPLFYQWFFNGTQLGEQGATLALANVQSANSGTYWAVVTNAYGSARTTNFSLTVMESAPVITYRATNVIVGIGGSTTLQPLVSGSTPMTLQWRYNGADIPGATSAALALSKLRYDQSGYYNLVAKNAYGEAVSVKILVSVVQVVISANGTYGLPTNVPAGLSNVVSVAAGQFQVLALRADGTVATWSANTAYRQPAASNLVGVSAIATSASMSMVLKTNGTVAAWSLESPYLLPNFTNIMAIAVGDSGFFGVKSNGTVISWQTPSYLTVPTNLSNVVSIAAGSQHCLALRSDGTVRAWGNNGFGQTNVPPGATNIIAISAGNSQSLALKADGTIFVWGTSTWMQNPVTKVPAVAISDGYYWARALLANGTVTNWGEVPGATRTNVMAMCASRGPISFGVDVIGDGSPVATVHPFNHSDAHPGDLVQFHSRFVGAQPMTYQWQLNGLDIAGATNVSLVISNAQGKDVGSYRLVAVNALGRAVSRPAVLAMPAPLGYALNAPGQVWTNTSYVSPGYPSTNVWWFGQLGTSHDGEAAAQSGAVADNQQAVLQTSFVGPGTLTFWWKVSSEDQFDYLSFYTTANGPANQYYARISGEVDWQFVSVRLVGGSSTVRWIYAKDVSVSSGRDCGWVDQVSFVPDYPVFVRQPQNQSAWAGTSVTFTAEASSASSPADGSDVTYQWLKSGASIPGATNSSLTLASLTRRDQDNYSVRASNKLGSSVSSNAFLTVWVAQRFARPERQPDGTMLLTTGDTDGAPLLATDISRLTISVSSNLVDWFIIPVSGTWAGGKAQWHDTDTNQPLRFYRVSE